MSSGGISVGLAAPALGGARGSDERLARRVAGGDARAFATLYERYHQRLFRYCLSILRDENDAADALQSTFERAFAALARAQRNAPLRPWLFRIAHNEAITVIRRRAPDWGNRYLGPPAARSAAHEADERGRFSTLVADLAELPERARSALVMRELEGLSHEDIAIALDASVGAAKQAIFEARRALAEAAEGREMSCEEIRRLISDGDRRVLRGRRLRAHLRDCRGCTEFAQEIPRRTAQLRALAPPLAPVAAASILARASGGLVGHGARSGLSTVGAGGLGKGGLAAGLGSKVAAGAAVMATATAGTAGVAVIEPLVVAHQAPRATVAPRSVRPAGSTAVVVRAAARVSSVTVLHHGLRTLQASSASPAHAASAPASTPIHGGSLGSSTAKSVGAGPAAHTSPGRAAGRSPWAPAGSHGAASQSAASTRPLRSHGAAPGQLRHTTASPKRSTQPVKPVEPPTAPAGAPVGPPGQARAQLSHK